MGLDLETFGNYSTSKLNIYLLVQYNTDIERCDVVAERLGA